VTPAGPLTEPAAGGADFIIVNGGPPSANCKYAAWSPDSWITVSPTVLTAIGTNTTLQITPQQPGAPQRQTTIWVADKQVTVIQLAGAAANSCTYNLSSTSSTSWPAAGTTAGQTGSFTVTIAGADCSLTAAIDPSVPVAQQFAHTYGSTTFSAVGVKTIQYTVDPNCTTAPRSINLVLTGANPPTTRSFTINQQAAAAACTPGPNISPGGITNSARSPIPPASSPEASSLRVPSSPSSAPIWDRPTPA
jgi:hypothetical protein